MGNIVLHCTSVLGSPEKKSRRKEKMTERRDGRKEWKRRKGEREKRENSIEFYSLHILHYYHYFLRSQNIKYLSTLALKQSFRKGNMHTNLRGLREENFFEWWC